MKATQAHIHDSLKQQKAREAAPTTPAPKPARTCRLCNRPLNALTDCSKHSVDMRAYKSEFDYRTNWPQKLSDVTAEEAMLEGREQELLSVAESLKDKRDAESRDKFAKIMGYDFKAKGTEKLEHHDGLLDVVRQRLAEINLAMPKLVNAAQAYLDEQGNVPSEELIFQQRRRESSLEKILR
jgi:hypothetical protein